MAAAACSLHVKDIFPARRADGFKSLFEFFDRLIAARVFDVNVAVICFCAEGDGSGGAHITLQVVQHRWPVCLRCVDAEDLFPFLTVKIVKVCTAPVEPGLLFELSMEPFDVFFMVDDQYV